MAKFEVYLSTDTGTRLALLDMLSSLEYSMVIHGVGACKIVLPNSFNITLLKPDYRIEIWRASEGGALRLERVYMIRSLLQATDAEGVSTITVTAYDGNYLLTSRIVAYAAGSAQSTMTDQADDMCKAIMTDAFGADATAVRQISSTYLSIDSDLAAGPSITKSFAHGQVLSVLQGIAETARAAGTDIYWDVEPTSNVQWRFRTNTGQLGQDHSYPSGLNPVILSLEHGNLSEPQLEQDYTDEVTYAYAGGQGEAANRTIVEAEDTTRSGRSIFGRREGWTDARNESTTGGVTAVANAALAEGRPRLRFSGKLVDSIGTKYGVHWRWGDRLTASYQGQEYSSVIRAVLVQVDANGKETIEARLETE
jgi:hypothetical protein